MYMYVIELWLLWHAYVNMSVRFMFIDNCEWIVNKVLLKKLHTPNKTDLSSKHGDVERLKLRMIVQNETERFTNIWTRNTHRNTVIDN